MSVSGQRAAEQSPRAHRSHSSTHRAPVILVLHRLARRRLAAAAPPVHLHLLLAHGRVGDAPGRVAATPALRPRRPLLLLLGLGRRRGLPPHHHEAGQRVARHARRLAGPAPAARPPPPRAPAARAAAPQRCRVARLHARPLGLQLRRPRRPGALDEHLARERRLRQAGQRARVQPGALLLGDAAARARALRARLLLGDVLLVGEALAVRGRARGPRRRAVARGRARADRRGQGVRARLACARADGTAGQHRRFVAAGRTARGRVGARRAALTGCRERRGGHGLVGGALQGRLGAGQVLVGGEQLRSELRLLGSQLRSARLDMHAHTRQAVGLQPDCAVFRASLAPLWRRRTLPHRTSRCFSSSCCRSRSTFRAASSSESPLPRRPPPPCLPASPRPCARRRSPASPDTSSSSSTSSATSSEDRCAWEEEDERTLAADWESTTEAVLSDRPPTSSGISSLAVEADSLPRRAAHTCNSRTGQPMHPSATEPRCTESPHRGTGGPQPPATRLGERRHQRPCPPLWRRARVRRAGRLRP